MAGNCFAWKSFHCLRFISSAHKYTNIICILSLPILSHLVVRVSIEFCILIPWQYDSTAAAAVAAVLAAIIQRVARFVSVLTMWRTHSVCNMCMNVFVVLPVPYRAVCYAAAAYVTFPIASCFANEQNNNLYALASSNLNLKNSIFNYHSSISVNRFQAN